MRAFLSHSSIDKPLATKIYRSLRDQPVSIWFDRLEMRPGDSLLAQIAEGINKSDYLLVLVTENSKRSSWVEKEVTIALTQEIQGRGPKVIPLLMKGCEIPTILADKYYISIDKQGRGIEQITTAIFRNSYILDIAFNANDLSCDISNMQEELYEFIRSDLKDLRVRIDTRNFNEKVIDIAAKTILLPECPVTFVKQVKDASGPFPIKLPIYWVNLSELLGQVINAIFEHYGRTLDAVSVALEVAGRSLEYAQFGVFASIRSAVFSAYAEQFDYPDIAAFIRRFEEIETNDEEKLARKICEFSSDDNLGLLELAGDKSRGIMHAKIYLPIRDQYWTLMRTCSPDQVITYETWFYSCLPQILGHFLIWTAFRLGRPLHESKDKFGLSLDDYEYIGLA
jgi:hypothetical protein